MSGASGAMQGIMGVVNIAMGDSKLNQGQEQKRKAQALRPPLEDPDMRTYLGYLERKRRSIETGGAYGNLYNQVGRNLANTQTGILQASGGNVGAAISGLTTAQRGATSSFGDILNRQNSDLIGWDNKYGNVLDQISRRKADLQLLKYNQEMAEAAAKISKGEQQVDAGTADLMGGLTTAMGGGF